VLAAHRAGLKRVILPKANVKDLEDLPEHVRHVLEVIPVQRVEEALSAASSHLVTMGTWARRPWMKFSDEG
jgi:ATP-dependent Lon protease